MIQSIKNTCIYLASENVPEAIVQFCKACGTTEWAKGSQIGMFIYLDKDGLIKSSKVKPDFYYEASVEQLIEFNNRKAEPETFTTDDGLVVFKKARLMEVSHYESFSYFWVRKVIAKSGTGFISYDEERGDIGTNNFPKYIAYAREIQP